MKKLRFLQSAYIPALKVSVNLNDELDIEDNLANILLKQGIADELKPELNGEKPEKVEKAAKKPRKPRKKAVEIDE